MNKYFSQKYFKISTLISVLETFKDTDKLMIHTANGIYMGDFKEPVKYVDLKAKQGDDFLTILQKTYLAFIEDNDIPENLKEFIENPTTIQLENVTLLTSGKTITLPFVEIFVDQIIGFSKGSLNSL